MGREKMSLDKVVSSVRKMLKDEMGSGLDRKVKYWIDSGALALNWAISGDMKLGWPGGKIVDLFGDPATGKSLLLYHLLGNVQRLGGVAVFDDAEGSYDSFFAEKAGVDNEQLLYFDPPSYTVEEHFKRVDKVVDSIRKHDSECPIVIALDSLAKLTTVHEAKTEWDKRDMTKAQAVHKGLRLYSKKIYEEGVLYIISNHTIAKIGGFGGRTTPGGKGFPFECSVRVCLDFVGKIKDSNKKIIGIKAKASIAKNRVAPPHKEVELEIYFDSGVKPTSGLKEVLILEGVVEESGAWVKYNGKSYQQFDKLWAEHGDEILGGKISEVEALVKTEGEEKKEEKK